jgi:hypothetical protein
MRHKKFFYEKHNYGASFYFDLTITRHAILVDIKRWSFGVYF